MDTIKIVEKNKNKPAAGWRLVSGRAICRALRTFAMSVGVTAVCMLCTLWALDVDAAQAQPAATAEVEAMSPGLDQGPQDSVEQSVELGENMVAPLGRAFGIKLFTDGVIVASLSDIYTANGICCPAQEAGLRPGDYLLEADGMEIQNNAALARYIGRSQGESISFKVRRGDHDFEASVTPVFGEGSFKTGMWVRDSAAGVGTLTFYDPATGRFAGLGHGICDSDAGSVMALKSGEPAEIALCGIIKGMPDRPGQLKGFFVSDEPLGRLLVNNETGVYGTLDRDPGGTPMEVLPKEQVKLGPVQLLVSIDQNGPRLYDAEITKLNGAELPTKNLVLRVTDPELLAATGGIVQGMSGAPILQDGKLCGAVTHVFTEEPTEGYGIFAQTMLEQCRGIQADADIADADTPQR